MEQSHSGRFDVDSIPALGWLAVALVVVTGVIHIYAGVVEGRVPVLLAGIGFLVAVPVYLAGYRRRLLYPVGAVYTAIQIPLWYVVKAGEYTTVGYVDKVLQAVLVVLLLYLYWRGRSAAGADIEEARVERSG